MLLLTLQWILRRRRRCEVNGGLSQHDLEPSHSFFFKNFSYCIILVSYITVYYTTFTVIYLKLYMYDMYTYIYIHICCVHNIHIVCMYVDTYILVYTHYILYTCYYTICLYVYVYIYIQVFDMQ